MGVSHRACLTGNTRVYNTSVYNTTVKPSHVERNTRASVGPCDEASYQYLVESIRKFPKQEELEEMMREAGFKSVSHENITGGVVAIHSGFKL